MKASFSLFELPENRFINLPCDALPHGLQWYAMSRRPICIGRLKPSLEHSTPVQCPHMHSHLVKNRSRLWGYQSSRCVIPQCLLDILDSIAKTYTTKDLSRIQLSSESASQWQFSSKTTPSFLDLQTCTAIRDGYHLLRLRRGLYNGHETILSLQTPPLHGLLETQPHP